MGSETLPSTGQYQTIGLPIRVELLQKADRLVFSVVCFLLTRLRRILPEPRTDEIPSPSSMLFVKLAEQGSTVLAEPVIRQAIKQVGSENVYFVVFQENRFVLDIMELIPRENVFAVPTTSLSAMIFGTIAALLRIRRLHIDSAVDLEFFARFSAAITWLSGARWRSGMHAWFGEGPYRGDLFTHRVLYNAHIHTSEMFFILAESLSRSPANLPTLGFSLKDIPPAEKTFVPMPGEITRVKALLDEYPALRAGAGLILLNANASDLLPVRRWPSERYGELARRLLEALPDACVAFTGMASEAEASEILAKSIGSPRCFSLAGRTSLRDLLVLYNLSDVLVTNDSGPAHFATLTSINVVTLFGPETPKLFAALTPRNTVIYAELPCSPCVNALNNRQTACRDNQCMKAITVDQVLEATMAAYAGRIEGRIRPAATS